MKVELSVNELLYLREALYDRLEKCERGLKLHQDNQPEVSQLLEEFDAIHNILNQLP